MRTFPILLLCLALPACVAHAQDTQPTSSRYRLKHAQAEPASQHGTRYTARARLAPASSAGELREGENFVLIARLAKAGVCGPAGDAIFWNGFEG